MNSEPQLPWNDITLTPLDAADVDAFYQWQNDPSVRDLTMGFRYPVARAQVVAWISEARSAGPRMRVVLAIKARSTLVGSVQLNDISAYNRTCSLGIYVGNQEWRGKGVAKVACHLVLDYAFNGLDLRRVTLEVISDNVPAIRLYKSIGFVEEGRKRQDYFVGGQHKDVLIFGLLRHDYEFEAPQQANRLTL